MRGKSGSTTGRASCSRSARCLARCSASCWPTGRAAGRDHGGRADRIGLMARAGAKAAAGRRSRSRGGPHDRRPRRQGVSLPRRRATGSAVQRGRRVRLELPGHRRWGRARPAARDRARFPDPHRHRYLALRSGLDGARGDAHSRRYWNVPWRDWAAAGSGAVSRGGVWRPARRDPVAEVEQHGDPAPARVRAAGAGAALSCSARRSERHRGPTPKGRPTASSSGAC